jgi:nitroreductase
MGLCRFIFACRSKENTDGDKKTNMKVIELIKQRRSIRTYTNQPLSKELKYEMEDFIRQTQAPFGIKARIELVSTGGDDQRTKLGTYGFISGATDYLALIYEEAPLAEEGGAYWFEQVILFCTGLGLGTCWLGGSFSRKDFKRQIQLNPNERLRIVSPVGYPSDKKRLFEVIQGAERHHISRKPFGTIFFHKEFTVPLTEAAAGIYAQPLEMVRRAPSANNAQPWRVVLDEGALHFYRTASLGGFAATDTGIALCHFEQTCKELGIQGYFKVLNGLESKHAQYCISWLPE